MVHLKNSPYRLQQLVDIFDPQLKGESIHVFSQVASHIIKNGILLEKDFPFVGLQLHEPPKVQINFLFYFSIKVYTLTFQLIL